MPSVSLLKRASPSLPHLSKRREYDVRCPVGNETEGMKPSATSG
jgi:hypothetical protein